MNELVPAQAAIASARANLVDALLGMGDVDAARVELGHVRKYLGAIPPESIGGGSDEMTTPKPSKARPPAKRRAAASKPRAAAGSAARGGTSQVGAARRTRRKFTETEKKDGAQLGRELGARKAAAQFDVADSVLRGWMKAFPAGSSFSAAS